ncbi:MAG: alpha/beta fold hydrolase, partial [Candidatus Kryptoniota bacterium]
MLSIIFSAAKAQTSADTSIVGSWQGTLVAGGAKLRIVFHVAKTDSGKLVSTLDSPDQGANGIPVSSTTVNVDSVTLTVASIGGSYVGRISGDKSSIEGKWNQNGLSFDLPLNRTTTEVKFNRPQEPKPPFPYKSEEVSFENETTGMKYAGTLTLPDSGGPFPAVILITGSGAHNRNEEVFGHKPFLVIADYLTRRGIAVLRVDDRGIGGSTGKKSAVTSADHAKDVIAEIEFLKSRCDIDPNKIGLIGHSEGGIIAPLVASQSKDVAFIVMLAGPGLAGGD